MDWIVVIIIIILIIVVALIISWARRRGIQGGQEPIPEKITHETPTYKYPVIFINGHPGAGKSYLGQQLAKKFPRVKVFDTDDIATEMNLWNLSFGMASPPSDEQTPEQNRQRWDKAGGFFTEQLTSRIKKLIDEFATNGPIIFVGTASIPIGDSEYYVDTTDIGTHNYFVDIPTDKLMQQLINRDYVGKICKSKKYLKDVKKGEAWIQSLDRAGVEGYAKILKNRYGKMNYKFLTQSEIQREIAHLVKEAGFGGKSKKLKK